MEIAGVETMNACSECLCVSCHKGFVHPTSTRDCALNSSNCEKCKQNLREGKPEVPIKTCKLYTVD